ncbi:unnamed protein product, partial [Dibothriocephalus latus]
MNWFFEKHAPINRVHSSTFSPPSYPALICGSMMQCSDHTPRQLSLTGELNRMRLFTSGNTFIFFLNNWGDTQYCMHGSQIPVRQHISFTGSSKKTIRREDEDEEEEEEEEEE